jgi:putative ABC transport system permease protein
MRKLRALLSRITGLWRGRSRVRDIDAELDSHIDLHVADFMRAGMSEPEAKRRALVALGGVAQTRERYRDRSRIQWLDELSQDVKFATRVLLKDRGFTAAVVAVLALGIGANAAIFAVVDALVLKPLPFFEPDRLAIVWEEAGEVGFPRNTPAPGNYVSWTERNRTFSDLAATRSVTANLTVDGPPEFVMGRRVTANFFDVLGVRPLVGRTFTEEEDRTGAPVVIISYGLWQRRYSGDTSIVGQTIVMNGQRRTIIGIMPRGFVFRDREREFWSPIAFTPEERTQRGSHFLNVVGRLAPGVTMDAARRDMERIAAELEWEFPRTNARVGVVVEPLRDDLLGNRRDQLNILMAASLCVLLIACANVAGLLLLRAFNRRGELAVRASMGATSGRIVRQLVAEGILLAFAGAIAGLALAPAGMRVLADMVPMGMFPIETSVLDFRVVAVTLTVALLTAVTFSLGPAWHAARTPLVESLQQAGRSRMTSTRVTREVLVVAQIAVALMLLVGTGLLLRTFANLRSAELGFAPDQLLTLRTTVPLTKYQRHADRVAFFDRVVAQVKAVPGVQNAAYVSIVPFGAIGNTMGLLVEGRNEEERQDALVRIGTVDYLRTIGAELVDGRLLDDRDRETAPGVVVISETFARMYWPGRSAVGRRVSLGGPDAMRTIVGVVRDVRERGYELEAKPAVYLANTQVSGTFFLPEILVVRGSGDLMTLVAPLRRAIANVDPEQPISAVRTMNELLDSTIVDRRQQTTLLGVFASISVILAALGLYAVLAYGVAQRRQEIAVRMAIGATRTSVLRAIAWDGQKLALIGVVTGLAAAWALSRTIESLLRDVTPSDPVTYSVAGAMLWVIALIACAIPALRAARVSPAVLLRGD